METIWGFARPHGVWIVRNGVIGKAGIAAPATWTTCSLMPSKRKHVLPSFGGSPKMRSTGHGPLGVTSPHVGHRSLPRRMLGVGVGGGRSQDHEWLCTDFAPSAIAGAGLHLPSTLLPLGCISAHFGAVIPARCTEKGERSRPWSLFELQLGKAPKYLHAQLEMHTYTYRHGSLEVPASRGTPLRGRSWKDTPPHTPRKIPARLSSVPRPPPAPLQTLTPPANLQLPEPTLQDAAHPSPPICSQTQGWGRTGGPRGETVVAGASPTHPLPLSTHSTAASTANRSAFMVGPAEMRRAAGCAQGWRQGRAPGVGKGQRPRPAGRPLPRTAFPHRLPRPRPVSFPRSGEPGPGKGAVSVAPVLASLPPPAPAEGA